jgi:hypothetical protein
VVQLLQNGIGGENKKPWALRKSNLFANPAFCHIPLRVFRNGHTNSDVETSLK